MSAKSSIKSTSHKPPDALLDKLKSVNKIDLIYTSILFMNYFAYGISVNIYGPILVDVIKVYDIELSLMSKVLVANIVGYMIGTLCGVTYRWLNRQLVLAVGSLLLGLANAFIPLYSASIGLAFAGFAIAGLGMGVIRACASVWLIDLWPLGSAAILQGCQFLYGLGTIAAPMLASRFVNGQANTTREGEVLTPELRASLLTVPLAVNGVLQVIPALLLILLFFIRPYKPAVSATPRKSIDFHHRASIFELSPALSLALKSATVSWRKTKLALGCLLYALYFTGETGYFPYATTMLQYLDIQLSAAEAASVMSVLSGMYTLGPVITAFVSFKLKSDYIIAYHYLFLITGLAVLFVGQTSKLAIFVGSGILGYGFSAMIPCINAFINDNFKLTNKVGSIYSFASSIASFLPPLLMGQFLKPHPTILLYMASILMLSSMTFFVIIKLWMMIGK